MFTDPTQDPSFVQAKMPTTKKGWATATGGLAHVIQILVSHIAHTQPDIIPDLHEAVLREIKNSSMEGNIGIDEEAEGIRLVLAVVDIYFGAARKHVAGQKE